MQIPPIQLRNGVGGKSVARLGRLDGRAELALADASFAGSAEIIADMLADARGAIAPEDLPELRLDDYDRILAALFRSVYGDEAELHVPCRSCGERFEITLPLDAAFPHLAQQQPQVPNEDCRTLAGGTVLRPLTVADVQGADDEVGPDTMLACAVETRGSDTDADVEAALEALCPLASEEIESRCPHCESLATCLFDLGRFLLASLAREKQTLVRELHVVARSYGWSLSEILSLPRDTRQQIVALITRSQPRRNNMVSL